ncbi:MAG: transposase [Pyrinomonadaceae bacterium]|nr:transposase [Pyrinomonadaceae bacterium]
MINKEVSESEETLRESYTLPKKEQDRLTRIQNKFSGIKPTIKKSEIVRVGIYKVAHLDEKDVKEILEEKLGRLSVGKPKKIAVIEQSTTLAITVNDKQWKAISTLFPVSKKSQGRPRAENRQVINGILYIFRYETQRRNVPEEYSSYMTCRRRLTIWRKNGFWKQICNSLVNNAFSGQKKELEGILLRTWLIDTNFKL